MKLIMPAEDGVPNLQIRRVQKEIEAERSAMRGIHSQTSTELAKALDRLRAMADREELRALSVVALTRPSRELPQAEAMDQVLLALAPSCKVLFSCPRTDRPLAVDLVRMTEAFLNQVMATQFPPPPPSDFPA